MQWLIRKFSYQSKKAQCISWYETVFLRESGSFFDDMNTVLEWQIPYDIDTLVVRKWTLEVPGHQELLLEVGKALATATASPFQISFRLVPRDPVISRERRTLFKQPSGLQTRSESETNYSLTILKLAKIRPLSMNFVKCWYSHLAQVKQRMTKQSTKVDFHILA